MEASSNAQRLGLNMEDGEIDVADCAVDFAGGEDWVSPFDVFDQPEFSDMRFFKKKTERGPVENLMSYGPDALRLPLAFLRYEVFGQVQSGITNDLQVGRGKESIQKRVSCEDVMSYEDRLIQCGEILQHVKNLQATSLHVLSESKDNVVAFPDAAKVAAKKAFSQMNRKGIDAGGENEEAFRMAADSLVVMAGHLEKYITHLQERKASEKFVYDQDLFKTQFSHLYEEALS